MPDTNQDPPDINRQEALSVLASIAPYLWPRDKPAVKIRVVASLLILLCAKIIVVITPFFYKAAVDTMTADGINSSPAMMVAIGAIGLTLAYGTMRIAAVGFNQLRDVVFARVGQRALRQLALETFQHIHRLSLRYHIMRKTGGLSRIIERGVKGVDFLLRYVLLSVGPLILELTFVCAILFFVFDIWYLLIVVFTVGLYIWFTFAITEWRVQIRKQMNDQDTEANQKAMDSLLNFETVKYFGAEEREAQRYDDSMRQYEVAALKTSYSLAALNFGQALFINLGLIGVMVLAAVGVGRGTLTVGDFVMVNAYMVQVTMPLNFLGTVYREIRQSLVDMGEMFDLLRQPQEVVDADDAQDLVVTGGAVSFENVVFGYGSKRQILKGINVSIGAGQTLAIVGPSGSGKSTIGRLLFRFYNVDSGRICIDGQDIAQVKQRSLHDAIGIVPQDTVLFNDTVGYNIGYGRAGADVRDIIAVAKAAKIHDFIDSMPDGYETTVGERGLKLSGGEKQRVGIARTLLKNPPILLLDEATSALDSETERDIQDSLRGLGHGRTVIMIAHRLSTVVEADLIVVLEEGVVVEQGRHEDLLAQGGRYATMWHVQAEEND